MPATTRPDAGRWGRGPSSRSGAGGQREAYVLGGLDRAGVRVLPDEETHAAAIVAAADLGVDVRARRERDADHLRGHVAVELQVEHAARRDLGARLALLARHPQQLAHRVAERADYREPVRDIGAAHFV